MRRVHFNLFAAETACINSDSVDEVARVACSFASQRTAAAKTIIMWPPVDQQLSLSVAWDTSMSVVTKYGSSRKE